MPRSASSAVALSAMILLAPGTEHYSWSWKETLLPRLLLPHWLRRTRSTTKRDFDEDSSSINSSVGGSAVTGDRRRNRARLAGWTSALAGEFPSMVDLVCSFACHLSGS